MVYNQSLICFFPYVEVTNPLQIRGEILFPISAIDQVRLSEADREHIRALNRLFYWYNNQPISNATWAILPAPTDRRRESQFAKHLEEIRKLLGYLCCIPDERPEYFRLIYNYEQVDCYLFEPSPLRLWKGFLNCIRFKETNPDEDEYFDEAYEYSLNQGDRWNIVQDCRIYPQSRSVSHSFKLDELLSRTQAFTPTVNALALFHLDQLDAEKEERVFNALEWYNRSCSERTTADVALISLAVAFETLLGVRRGDTTEKQPEKVSIRDRLFASIQLLLGEVPRLSEWLDQFYDARSRILHEGEWSQLRFSVAPENSKPESLKSEYGYLIHYGWLIFRVCTNSFLSGPLQVARIDLKSKFFHNQERLERIQKTLIDTKDTFEALNSVLEDIKVLYRYPSTHFRPVNLETVYEVGVSLANKLLQLGDDLSNDQKGSLAEVISAAHSPDPEEIKEIIQHIVLLMQSTDELPYEEVRQPAIKQLK